MLLWIPQVCPAASRGSLEPRGAQLLMACGIFLQHQKARETLALGSETPCVPRSRTARVKQRDDER